ncbi:MAG: hypothetical protein MJD61_13440 [Proteobacteria bacterium]|nr:hypothetical protein [Pseudomonadota bacterium]
MRNLGPVIVSSALLTGASTAEPTLFPFQYNGPQFMERPGDPFAQVMYIEGLSDALTYITSENAMGAELSACHYGGTRIDPIFLLTRTSSRIENDPEPKPIIATLMEIMREACQMYLK